MRSTLAPEDQVSTTLGIRRGGDLPARGVRPQGQGGRHSNRRFSEEFVLRILDIFHTAVRSILDFKVVLAILLAVVWLISQHEWLLPPGDRKLYDPLSSVRLILREIGASHAALAGSVALNLIQVVVFVLVVGIQMARIRKQGTENKKLLDRLDPDRASSRNPKTWKKGLSSINEAGDKENGH